MRADASCVLIHDAFPKARRHALVMPRDPGRHDVTSLTRAHLPLLDRMEARACFGTHARPLGTGVGANPSPHEACPLHLLAFARRLPLHPHSAADSGTMPGSAGHVPQ